MAGGFHGPKFRVVDLGKEVNTQRIRSEKSLVCRVTEDAVRDAPAYRDTLHRRDHECAVSEDIAASALNVWRIRAADHEGEWPVLKNLAAPRGLLDDGGRAIDPVRDDCDL